MTTALSQFSYVPEWNSTFLSLFPHRYDYIQAPLTEPGEKPQWRTESRHPLSDRILTQGGSLFGVRFGPDTKYCLLDIDIASPYHPQQDELALPRLLASLEPLGLTTPLICTSSYSEGLHLYFPFRKAQRSWKLASAVATLLTVGGFKLRPGQLEVFPNTKQFIKAGSPSLFNAHRLPLQEPGSKLLNDALEPRWSSPEQFVTLWQRCQSRNEISALKIQTVLKQHRRKRYFVSEKADKFLNDLNAEIEPGWTGKGQTNHLLGRITMRCFIFHHVLAGGMPLSGQFLIDEIITTAKSLPGYKTWCRHQHELVKRATDWARCIENSHYFPYGSQHGKYKATGVKSANQTDNVSQLPSNQSNASQNDELTWNQKQSLSARTKIIETVQQLKKSSSLPSSITERFQALTQAGIGGSSLYRYKELWHPKFEQTKTTGKTNKKAGRSQQTPKFGPFLQECPPARLDGAANWHIPTSLLFSDGRKTRQDSNLKGSREFRVADAGRNSNASTPDFGADEGLSGSRDEITQRIRAELAHVNQHRLWTVVPSQQESEPEQRQDAAQAAFVQQIVGYLSSGSPILVSEALEVLSQRLELLQEGAVAEALVGALETSDELANHRLTNHSLTEIETQDEQAQSRLPDNLLLLFQAFLRLGWLPEQIRADLQQQFGLQVIAQLSASQLGDWLTQLLQRLDEGSAGLVSLHDAES